MIINLFYFFIYIFRIIINNHQIYLIRIIIIINIHYDFTL